MNPLLPRPAVRAVTSNRRAVVLLLLIVTAVVVLPSVPSEQVTLAAAPAPSDRFDPLAPSVAVPTAGGSPIGSGGPGAAPTGGGAVDAGGAGAVGGCPDRPLQVPGDPYSPPCTSFAGANPGPTTTGVTESEIVISYRLLQDDGIQAMARLLGGPAVTYTTNDVRRTVEGLVDYFNQRFEFYDRQLRVEFFDGRGSTLEELTGGGQEEAEADAVRVSEIAPFAEANAATAPFADAVGRRRVIAFGAPYQPRSWYADRSPYQWSIYTDCTTLTEMAGEYAVKRLLGRQARWAGGVLQNQTRRIALVSPDMPQYAECIDEGARLLEQHGYDFVRVSYRLDIASMSNQAASVVARLRDAGVTTVLCGCEPSFPLFLTAKAHEQRYEPEWLVVGAALMDQDVVGQAYNQDQWSRAFGITPLGAPQPLRASLGYNAYKSVRVDEPAPNVDLIYQQLYMLAIGIQGAGPTLTPDTFAQGMFAYPPRTGPYGAWAFAPGDHTPGEDTREMWWDPTARSAQNGEQGAYVDPAPGQRYSIGAWPSTEPQVFTR